MARDVSGVVHLGLGKALSFASFNLIPVAVKPHLDLAHHNEPEEELKKIYTLIAF